MLVFQHLLSIILSSFLIASTIAQWSPNYPVAMMAERRPFTEETIKATVFLFGSESDVVGHLVLTQQGEDEPLIIQGKIKGLSRGTKHGFHVHQYGDVFTEGCDSTGTHYNPLGASHGGPHGGERHVGDLGNIEADSYGVATVKMVDSVIRLTGPHSIIGRAFVVHEKEDDLTTTANPGKRLACGTIALSK